MSFLSFVLSFWLASPLVPLEAAGNSCRPWKTIVLVLQATPRRIPLIWWLFFLSGIAFYLFYLKDIYRRIFPFWRPKPSILIWSCVKVGPSVLLFIDSLTTVTPSWSVIMIFAVIDSRVRGKYSHDSMRFTWFDEIHMIWWDSHDSMRFTMVQNSRKLGHQKTHIPTSSGASD